MTIIHKTMFKKQNTYHFRVKYKHSANLLLSIGIAFAGL